MGTRSILVKNYATVAHAAPVGKPYLTRSPATAAGLYSTHRFHAARNRLPVHTNAIGAQRVATLQSTTNATAMESPAPSVHTSCKRLACAARKSLKINRAGPPRSHVGRLAGIAFVVAFTPAKSLAIGRATARMLCSPSAPMFAVRPRPHQVAATCALSPVTHHTHAKKKSRVRPKSS